MFGASRDIDKFLCVGTVMLLQAGSADSDKPRLKTVLRGWRVHHHLILDSPQDDKGEKGVLYDEEPCVVRFLLDGRACAFESQVISSNTNRAVSFLSVKWPEELTYTSFRQSERVNVSIACEAKDEAGIPHAVELHDLSVGGFRLLCAKVLPEGSKLVLSFETPDRLVFRGVQVLVRTVREAVGGYHLGCQMLPGQEIVCNDIEFLVNTTLAGRRTLLDGEKRAPVVLVIDNSIQVHERLKQALKDQPVEVVWAGNVLDGMCRLRMLSPVAAMLDSHLPHMDPADFCQIVRNVNGFADLPIYIFGDGSPGAGERARQAGATAFVLQSPTLTEDLVFAVTSVLRELGQK